MSIPPVAVKSVVDRGVGRVTRAVEIYEADGVTLWEGGLGDRLIGGNVNVTYGDNERRALDITLSNQDNRLRSSSDGFWYDKVVKLYRGVKYFGSESIPPSVIIEHPDGAAAANKMSSQFARLGLPGAEVNLSSTAFGFLDNYDIIISYTRTAQSARGVLLQSMFEAGKSIITISTGNTDTVVPFLENFYSAGAGQLWGIDHPAGATFLQDGWSTASAGTSTGMAPRALAWGATAIARYPMADASSAVTASVYTGPNGARWVDLHLKEVTGTQVEALTSVLFKWLVKIGEEVEWQTQLGEFVIDSIANSGYPKHMKATGRDYVKKCMASKIENASTFAADTPVSSLVIALASNAGITKKRVVPTAETIGSTMTFDRGTSRWEIMKKASNAQGYELFFDNEGYLILRKYLDPTLGKASTVFQTGLEGNLSSLDQVTNDSRIYNHITVYGDPTSGEARLPYFGEAKNTNHTSPTRIAKIGDRLYTYASTFFTNEQQAIDYAKRLLKQVALESYELSFSSIAYPWMEVGEISKVIDPNAGNSDPDQYLTDSFSIPLALGPMSMTGKRIMNVG